MPIPEKWVYITTPYMGYLSAIRQFGPIAHPAKVRYDEAVALMMAGAQITLHDPQTKMTYPLTLGNVSAPQPPKEMPKPITETKLHGVRGTIGEVPNKKPEPVAVEAPVEEPVSVVEEVQVDETANPLEDALKGIADGTLTESDIIWNKFTKAERRQLRNALNATKTTEETVTE